MEEGRSAPAFGGQTILTTIEKRLVLKKLGQFQPTDLVSLRTSTSAIIG